MKVFYYGANDPAFYLHLGDASAGRIYDSRLARLYPDALFFNSNPVQFEKFFGVVSFEAAARQFSRQKCVYFMGVPWENGFGIPRSAFTLIAPDAERNGLNLYELKPGWNGH